MNALVPVRASDRSLTAGQLDLIKRTVAKDANATEFDHFMHTASHLGLDPLRKQIMCMIFNKHDDKKRSMTIIVPQDGLRVIAARQRDYGPARDEPEIEYDPELKSDTNPHGIVRAKVTLWKRYSDGWQPVVATAYWDEFAAIDEDVEWKEGDDGKRRPHKTGKVKLADNWKRMGRVMIAKCATCQALRAGWPDDFSGVYGEEEMQKAIIIEAASEVVAEYQETERMKRVGSSNALLFMFDPAAAFENVERGQIADRLIRFYEREAPNAQAIIDFRQRNEQSLKTFWAWEPNDALAAKRIAEDRIAKLIAAHKIKSGGDAGKSEDAGKAANSGGAPGGAEPSASSSLFDELKTEGEALRQLTGARRRKTALAAWSIKLGENRNWLAPHERADLDALLAALSNEIPSSGNSSPPVEEGASADGLKGARSLQGKPGGAAGAPSDIHGETA